MAGISKWNKGVQQHPEIQMPATHAYLTSLGMEEGTATRIIEKVIVDSEGGMKDIDLNQYDEVRALHEKVFGIKL